MNLKQRIYRKLRECIAKLCETKSPFTNGEMELDESYFGARRVGGIRECAFRQLQKTKFIPNFARKFEKTQT